MLGAIPHNHAIAMLPTEAGQMGFRRPEHGQRSSVGADLGINAHLADQLRHGSVDVRLDPSGTMVQAEERQTRQENTT